MIVRQVPLKSLTVKAPMEMFRGHAFEDWTNPGYGAGGSRAEAGNRGAGYSRRAPGSWNAALAGARFRRRRLRLSHRRRQR
jgi:hypothetical protein